MSKQDFVSLALTHLRLIADAYNKAYPEGGWLHVDMDVQQNRLTVHNAFWGRDAGFPVNVTEKIVPDKEDAP